MAHGTAACRNQGPVEEVLRQLAQSQRRIDNTRKPPAPFIEPRPLERNAIGHHFAGEIPGKGSGGASLKRRVHIFPIFASVRNSILHKPIDRPKTGKSVRFVALSEGLSRDLELWLEQCPSNDSGAWLFPSEKTTKPIRKDNVWRRYIKPKLKDTGLDWLDFHVLRRTHSSLMRELNVDPKLVADQQGHTLDVNINVYTQTSLESRIDAVSTLESALIN